jgi:hypothetical protein
MHQHKQRYFHAAHRWPSPAIKWHHAVRVRNALPRNTGRVCTPPAATSAAAASNGTGRRAPAARKGSLRIPQYAGGGTGSRRLPGSAWRPGPAAQDSLGKPSASGLPVRRATGQASRWTPGFQRGRPLSRPCH